MESIRLICEVVTPLFCGGADQRPEIRVPSIRGGMRFWFRALMGGIVGDDIETLRALETTLFGATEQASTVRVRVHSVSSTTGTFNFGDSHLRYLGYGLGGRRRNDPARDYLAPGTRFSIDLFSRDRNSQTRAIWSLWLFLTLGALGSRSRRGWGSIQVTEITGSPDIQFVLPRGPQIKSAIQSTLRTVRQSAISEYDAPQKNTSAIPQYSCLRPAFWRCKLVSYNEDREPFRNWSEALTWTGERLRQFREDPQRHSHQRAIRGRTIRYRIGRDYDEVKKAISQGSQEQVGALQVPIFGLPVQYRFNSAGGATVSVRGTHHDRRGSPLWIRAYKSGSVIWLGFMLFKAQFLPAGERLVVRGREKELHAAQPDYDLLEEFFERLPGEEITL